MRYPLRLAAALTLLAACSDPAAPDPVGKWGGPEANLQLTAGGGSVDFGCGSSEIDSGWTIGAHGRWSATGLYYAGGGPSPPPGAGQPRPATFTGQIRGPALTFSMVIPDIPDTLGPFTLLRGRTVDLYRCL